MKRCFVRLRGCVVTLLWLACAGESRPSPDGGPNDVAGDVAGETAAPESFVYAPPALLARRLAKFLWDLDQPPPELLTELQRTPLDGARLALIADAMLSDPRADSGVRAFFRWWLNPGRPLDAGPGDLFTPAGAALEEAPAVGTHVTLEMHGTYEDLLTAPFTFVNEALAADYGITNVDGEHMRRVPYPAEQNRFGLLTGAGLMRRYSTLEAEHSWPAPRSWLVVDAILCRIVDRAPLIEAQPDPNKSIRQQMLDFTNSEGCLSCHHLLNSPGFAFIGFDTHGRWHPTPGHGAGETEGWIPAELLEDEPHFEGPESLARLLIARPRATQCLTSAWLQYATEATVRPTLPVRDAHASSFSPAYAAFEKAAFRLRDLPIAIVQTRAFAAAP
jgi:hypothetical protein